MGVPGLSLAVLGILGIQGYSDTRGGGGWESLDCPWLFWVSSAYGDTQTQGSPWTVLDGILGVHDMFAWTSIGTPRQSGHVCLDILGKHVVALLAWSSLVN